MRILIAEDEPISRRMLGKALTAMGHEVLSAVDGVEAWRMLQDEDARLVIADWEMPNMDGLQLVKKIREGVQDSYTYVILLTSRTQKTDKVAGLEAGADDYITKPFDRDELMVRIRAGERIIALQEQLAEQNAQLERMALADGLTGIGNRRYFDDEFRKLRMHCRRYQRPYSVLMIDIDRFKIYNDSLGHEAGDRALQQVALVIEESIRTSDAAFRYGGEEFACLLPETRLDGAIRVAERLRERVEESGIQHPNNPPTDVITISVGVSSYDTQSRADGEEVLTQADKALYEAKNSGRNRIAAFAHQTEPALY